MDQLDMFKKPETKQNLLYVGRLREKLELLAAKEGKRWQDVARHVLQVYLDAR
jgi:hypothetical protein